MAFTSRTRGLLARVGGELRNLGLRDRTDLQADPTSSSGFGAVLEQLVLSDLYIGLNSGGDALRVYGSDGSTLLLTVADATTTFENDIVFEGNVTFNGGNVTVEGTTVTYEDSILLLAKDQETGTLDAGFIVERGSDANVAFIWDESADAFVLCETTDTGTDGSVSVGTLLNLQVGELSAASAVRLTEALAPSNGANVGFFYVKDVGGNTEAFYMDSTGNEVQLTNAGDVNVTVAASDLDDAYNEGRTITVDAGPILANLAYNVAGFTAHSVAVGTAANDLSNTWVGYYFALGADEYTGAGSALKADFSAATLNSASSFYAVDLTGVTNSGAGSSVGIAMSGFDIGIQLLDDDMALTIGAGSDLSLSHDGTNSTIANATGNLVIDLTHATNSGTIQLKLGVDNSTQHVGVYNDSGTAVFQVNGAGAVTVTGNVGRSSGDLVLHGGMGGGAVSVRANGSGSANGIDISSSAVTSYQDIVPSADDSKDLGSNSARYAELHARKIVRQIVSGNSATGAPSTAGSLCIVASDGLQLADAAAFSTSGIVEGPYTGTAGQVYGQDSEAISLPKMATNGAGTLYEAMAVGDLVYLAAALADEYDAGVTPAKGVVTLQTPNSAGTTNSLVGRVVATSGTGAATVSVALRLQYLGTN
jgi:hypothetical protein